MILVTSTNANFKSVINTITAGYRRFKLNTTPFINNLHMQLHSASEHINIILTNYDKITTFNQTYIPINFL